jgi:hypothetical protein
MYVIIMSVGYLLGHMSLEVVEYLQEEATTLMDEVPNQKES